MSCVIRLSGDISAAMLFASRCGSLDGLSFYANDASFRDLINSHRWTLANILNR